MMEKKLGLSETVVPQKSSHFCMPYFSSCSHCSIDSEWRTSERIGEGKESLLAREDLRQSLRQQ